MHIDLIGHGGFYNRGCEAIVRSTRSLLRDGGVNIPLRLVSAEVDKDSAEINDSDIRVAHGVRPSFLDEQNMRFHRRFGSLGKGIAATVEVAQSVWDIGGPKIEPPACALSIGGDNFTLDYGPPTPFKIQVLRYMRMKVPTVIWGASIGSFAADRAIERSMASFLRRVDLITARESVTCEYLASIGVTENVVRVWDPAFFLETQPYEGPARDFVDGTTLALNVSALIAKWYKDGSVEGIQRAVAAFIERVVAKGHKVVLVPHVSAPDKPLVLNDEQMLQGVLGFVKNGADRVLLMPSGVPAGQIKWVLARCQCVIAARTHATIGAVSRGVPTVAIAYSQKARGIWRDIFGNEDLLLPTNQLSVESLTAKWEYLVENNSAIRKVLADKHPEMVAGARRNASALKELLQKKGRLA